MEQIASKLLHFIFEFFELILTGVSVVDGASGGHFRLLDGMIWLLCVFLFVGWGRGCEFWWWGHDTNLRLMDNVVKWFGVRGVGVRGVGEK
jgi:hypothetical protein